MGLARIDEVNDPSIKLAYLEPGIFSGWLGSHGKNPLHSAGDSNFGANVIFGADRDSSEQGSIQIKINWLIKCWGQLRH